MDLDHIDVSKDWIENQVADLGYFMPDSFEQDLVNFVDMIAEQNWTASELRAYFLPLEELLITSSYLINSVN